MKDYDLSRIIKLLLVISTGCSIPNRYKIVGAMSERVPLSMNFTLLWSSAT
jgi:hypothetical protein